jgi:hypothetical protein
MQVQKLREQVELVSWQLKVMDLDSMIKKEDRHIKQDESIKNVMEEYDKSHDLNKCLRER